MKTNKKKRGNETVKWYDVEIPYTTAEDIKRANNFNCWLHDFNIKHENSACGNMVHIEIFASENDLYRINKALDEIVWFDAITAM